MHAGVGVSRGRRRGLRQRKVLFSRERVRQTVKLLEHHRSAAASHADVRVHARCRGRCRAHAVRWGLRCAVRPPARRAGGGGGGGGGGGAPPPPRRPPPPPPPPHEAACTASFNAYSGAYCSWHQVRSRRGGQTSQPVAHLHLELVAHVQRALEHGRLLLVQHLHAQHAQHVLSMLTKCSADAQHA